MGEGNCVSSSEIINMLLACSEPISSGEKMTLKSLSFQNVALDIFYSPEPETPGTSGLPNHQISSFLSWSPHLSVATIPPFSESPSSPICSYLFLS